LFKRDWPFPPHIQDMLAALQHWRPHAFHIFHLFFLFISCFLA
jgi:hypothetical protein